MSTTSDTASLGSFSSNRGNLCTPAAIAAYRRRRLRGDYGKQPNSPSIGIKMDDDAYASANKATSSDLGPHLWYPTKDADAHRASELASANNNLGPHLWYPTKDANAHKASELAMDNNNLGPHLWYPTKDANAHKASEMAMDNNNLGPHLWYPTKDANAHKASELAMDNANLGPHMWSPTKDANAHKASEMAMDNANLGPRVWSPNKDINSNAHKASEMAIANARSYNPSSVYAENPSVRRLASMAATTATSVSGEAYGEKHYPEAYKWGRRDGTYSVNAHIGAVKSHNQASQQSAANNQTSISLAQMGASHSLAQSRKAIAARRTMSIPRSKTLPDPDEMVQAMDYTKIMATAERNAHMRVVKSQNRSQDDYGIPTQADNDLRRQQVLSLITIADANVKQKMADLDRRNANQVRNFGSTDYQQIALDVAARNVSQRMENTNSGKINLGGGLFMNPDAIDDIARQHVQPVLDKVEQVAQKKRITDRETAARASIQKETVNDFKQLDRAYKAELKKIAQNDKAQLKQVAHYAKQKSRRENSRSTKKAAATQNNVQALWQSVEFLKEDVTQAKTVRSDLDANAAYVERVYASYKEQLDNANKYNEQLGNDISECSNDIETRKNEMDEQNDITETVSLFEKEQELETSNLKVRIATKKQEDLENLTSQLQQMATNARKKADDAHEAHHQLKAKYFALVAEAEEAQKKFEADEQARKDEEERLRQERAEQEQERLRQEREAAEAAGAVGVAAGAAAGAAAGSVTADSNASVTASSIAASSVAAASSHVSNTEDFIMVNAQAPVSNPIQAPAAIPAPLYSTTKSAVTTAPTPAPVTAAPVAAKATPVAVTTSAESPAPVTVAPAPAPAPAIPKAATITPAARPGTVAPVAAPKVASKSNEKPKKKDGVLMKIFRRLDAPRVRGPPPTAATTAPATTTAATTTTASTSSPEAIADSDEENDGGIYDEEGSNSNSIQNSTTAFNTAPVQTTSKDVAAMPSKYDDNDDASIVSSEDGNSFHEAKESVRDLTETTHKGLPVATRPDISSTQKKSSETLQTLRGGNVKTSASVAATNAATTAVETSAETVKQSSSAARKSAKDVNENENNQFTGFDSSNVEVPVTPGVFKENFETA